jgi:hypothetical protein
VKARLGVTALTLVAVAAGVAILRPGGTSATPSRAAVPVAATTTLPRVTWLPAGYKLVMEQTSRNGTVKVYRTMTQPERIAAGHIAPLGSVAISAAPKLDGAPAELARETVRSGAREYTVLTDVGPDRLVVIWRYDAGPGVQVATSGLSRATAIAVADGLVAA